LGLQNSVVSLWHREKKLFCQTKKFVISQTVRNECTRFGGHVDIEVSYKILQLEILNEALVAQVTLILLNVCSSHLVFTRGYFETILIENTQKTLGIK
jgi:hypothetical protein